MTEKPTRRALMKPLQLLGLAFGAAVFAGIVTLVSMGFFQQRQAGEAERALVVAGVMFGIVFIVMLVGLALLILVVDPTDVQKTVDRPVLYPKDDDKGQNDAPDAAASGDPKA